MTAVSETLRSTSSGARGASASSSSKPPGFTMTVLAPAAWAPSIAASAKPYHARINLASGSAR